MVATPRVVTMSRRALWLFLAVGVIWGIPYLFIKIALVELQPHEIVFIRTALGALLLLPLAVRRDALRPALQRWPMVLLLAVIEMFLPWVFLNMATQRVSSGFAGLYMAMVPLLGAIALALLGERHAVAGIRLMGIATGMTGVVVLVGLDTLGGHVDLVGVGLLTLTVLGYTAAPILIARRLSDIPAIGVITLALGMAAVMSGPWALATLPGEQITRPMTWVSIVVLGAICSALAFVLFFALIAEIGAARATIITFINPAVAIVAGWLFLREPITVGTIVGFPLVLLGSWLATRDTPGDAEVTELMADTEAMR